MQHKKIRKIYLQVPHKHYFQALQSFQMFTAPLFEIKLHLLSAVLLGGFQSSTGVRQYLVNFMGRAGTVNATVYKTRPIFTSLQHGKFS